MNFHTMFGGQDEDTTKLQDSILREYDMGVSNPKQIAANCDCSESYVKSTLNGYRENWDEESGFGIF